MPIGELVEKQKQKMQVGTIALGVKLTSRSGALYPKETDYFVIKNPEDHRMLVEHYGPQPKSLDIIFHSDDEDLIAKTYLQMYKCENPKETDMSKRRNYIACVGTGLVRGQPSIAFWGDLNKPPSTGLIPMTEEFKDYVYRRIEELKTSLYSGSAESPAMVQKEIIGLESVLSGRTLARHCYHRTCPQFLAKECKALMTMSFMIPLDTVFGNFVLRTGNGRSMDNILTCIRSVKEASAEFSGSGKGFIKNLPLTLSRVRTQQRYRDPKTGEMVFSEHYPLVMNINHNFKDRFQNTIQSRIFEARLAMQKSSPMIASLEAPGAAVVDEVMPDDLYPTAEEQATALEAAMEEAALQGVVEAEVEDSSSHVPLEEKASWILDEKVVEAMNLWEAKLNRPFPTGKRIAHAQKFETKEALLEDLARRLTPVQAEPPINK